MPESILRKDRSNTGANAIDICPEQARPRGIEENTSEKNKKLL